LFILSLTFFLFNVLALLIILALILDLDFSFALSFVLTFALFVPNSLTNGLTLLLFHHDAFFFGYSLVSGDGNDVTLLNRHLSANLLILGLIYSFHFGVHHYLAFDLGYVGAKRLFDLLFDQLTLLFKDLLALAIIDDLTLLLGHLLTFLFHLAIIHRAADFFGCCFALLLLSGAALLFIFDLALVFVLSDVIGLAHLLLDRIAGGDVQFLTFLLGNGFAFFLGYLLAFS